MSSLVPPLQIRPVTQADHHQWLPLWQGYNAFYGRAGETALPGQSGGPAEEIADTFAPSGPHLRSA